MNFNAAIKGDSAGQLKGGVKCQATATGLTISKGKEQFLVPVGTPAAVVGNVVQIQMPHRQISLAVQKFGAYQGRIGTDLAAFLRGERPPLQDADYKLEPYLLILSLLPFGIMVVTRGGAIWGALGGAAAMGCLVVAQNDKIAKPARLLIILAVNAVAYGAVIALMANLTRS